MIYIKIWFRSFTSSKWQRHIWDAGAPLLSFGFCER